MPATTRLHRLPHHLSILLCLAALLGFFPQSLTASLNLPSGLETHPAIRLGLNRLEAATAGLPGSLDLTLALDPALPAESFTLAVASPRVTLTARDTTGAMYGLFDLAETLRITPDLAALRSKTAAPAHPFRAIKFNLPWDAYRSNEAITLHTATCRDPAFWEAFLNMMAENRFNALTLWNLHPFPYLIRAKNFPEACPFTDAELAEWRELHRTIFRLARERGIETYLVNWNIFVSPAFAAAHKLPGVANLTTARGCTPEQAELVRRYNRESVTQLINEYPDLTGIGLSLGEAMGDMTAEERQSWINDTLLAGLAAADRPARLIHRVPFSAGLVNGGTTSRATEELTRAALEKITGVTLPIIVEAKFNWSHAHSTPKLIKVHGGALTDAYWNPAPDHYRMAWMMRNEDFFTLRWGNTDFIREAIARNSGPHVTGYFLGSECYIPATDYFTKNTSARSWKYAFERQWLYYQTWGRLLYDPATPEKTFSSAYAERYGPVLGPRLYDAMRLASRVPLRLTSFIDIDNDKSFYAEGFLARERLDSSQFLDLNLLLKKDTLDPELLSCAEHAKLLVENRAAPAEKLTPLALAALFDHECEQVLAQLADLSVSTENESLRQELTDLRAWAHLGRYTADKLRATVAFGQFRLTKNETHRTAAREHLTRALAHWDELIAVTDPVYATVPLTHLHYYEQPPIREVRNMRAELKPHFLPRPDNKFSWSHFRSEVLRDFTILDEEK